MELESKRPGDSGPLFRIGRGVDAWQPPNWAFENEDHTFGNRFDDPNGVYRVIYAASQRLGCFLETMARFRVSLAMIEDLALMEGGEDDFAPFGTVDRTWVKARSIGNADVSGEFADVYAVRWVAHLRWVLAAAAKKLGISDIDLSTLERAEPRILTQKAGREAYAQGFDGVYYHSRYGRQIDSWAIFELDGFPLSNTQSTAITEADPDLQEAMGILRLSFVD
jgi:hypothetical protein